MKKLPTQKQVEARIKLGEMAKARAKARQSDKIATTIDLNTKDEYSITCNVNDKEMKCNTDDISKAIEDLGKEIKRPKTRMLFKIEKDGKSFEKLLFVKQVKRLFVNAMARRLFVKHIFFK